MLSSSMAQLAAHSRLIRGHEGTIIMVEHGMFERLRITVIITVKPEMSNPCNASGGGTFPDYKFGKDEIKIPVEQSDMMTPHVGNFLAACGRARNRTWMSRRPLTRRSRSILLSSLTAKTR